MTNTSEPAFPVIETNESCSVSTGMSLRDYFAAKAMQGFAADTNYGFDRRLMARHAYEWADAMLEQRVKL